MAIITAFTRETFEHTLPTIQNTVETTLSQSINLSLDGIAITGTDDLIRLLDAERIGRETSVSFMRDGKIERSSLRAAERGR